jgi:hypothetical protein
MTDFLPSQVIFPQCYLLPSFRKMAGYSLYKVVPSGTYKDSASPSLIILNF